MEELDDQESGSCSAFLPALVSLTPFTPSVSPSPRRLSSRFTEPSKPVRAKRQLAWVSFLSRLVGAEEAIAAKTIDRNGAFSATEAAAWELFTPIQRVLVVAVVAVAAINSKKNKQIVELQKSVELRDQVLKTMQQKLDNLCQHVSCFKDQPEAVSVLTAVTASVKKGTDSGSNPCNLCNLPAENVSENTSPEISAGEGHKCKTPHENVVEQVERRMSDLSDWAPSVASSVDIQLDNLSIEHEVNSLQKECEQKDCTINKLLTSIQSSEAVGSKRTAELEEIVNRKNMIINKLKKDILVLEQTVMELTRLKRASFSSASSNAKQLPLMTENVLYNMESTTSPSSSDSDSCPRSRKPSPPCKNQEISVQIKEKTPKADQKCVPLKSSKITEQQHRESPLKERSPNQTPNSVPTSKLKHVSGGENRTRRRRTARYKEVTAPKRWI